MTDPATATAAQDCCPGEPCYGDPNGMHTFDCPVYLANVEVISRMNAMLHPEMPCGQAETHDLHQWMAPLGRFYCCSGEVSHGMPTRDHCGDPDHDHCVWCLTPTPGAASRPKDVTP